MPSGQPAADVPLPRLQRLRALQDRVRELEQQRLADLDVFELIGYQPHQQQALFHAATEFDVLYGGAAGGGKSAALVAEGLRACAQYPGLRVLLVRRTYDELEESIFPALRKFQMGLPLGARWNGTARELSFGNGSIFRFRYMETLAHASRRQGGEYQLLLVDELTLLVPGVIDILRFERLRSSAGQPVIGVRCTSNPGGPGHGQVKQRYIDSTAYGRRVNRDEHGLTVRFIQAKATDNPHLDPGYESRLDAIPDPARRAAMRDGDWDQFAGMIFKEFSRTRHTLDPIQLPLSWRRYNGIDWGFAAPWAVLWAAVDEDERVWLYREIYRTQIGERDQALQILGAEEPGEHLSARYADDAMWASRGDAKPISDIYGEEGVHLSRAGHGPGSRVHGWQRWHTYLQEAPACFLHRSQGQDTCPKIHIFRTCENLLSELTNLPYAMTGNPEDSDPNAPDHAMDAGRYLLMNLGTGPQFVILEDPKPGGLEGIEVLEPAGVYAVRPGAERELFQRDEDLPPAGGMQRSPFT